MRKKSKSFDCVQMKRDIQAKLAKEWEGLTDEEIRTRIQQDLATSDDPVARKWRELVQHKAATAKR